MKNQSIDDVNGNVIVSVWRTLLVLFLLWTQKRAFIFVLSSFHFLAFWIADKFFFGSSVQRIPMVARRQQYIFLFRHFILFSSTFSQPARLIAASSPRHMWILKVLLLVRVCWTLLHCVPLSNQCARIHIGVHSTASPCNGVAESAQTQFSNILCYLFTLLCVVCMNFRKISNGLTSKNRREKIWFFSVEVGN